MGTADAVWPVSLPRPPRLEGMAETFPALTVRTQMDAGPAKVRRRFTAGVRTYSVVFDMTRAQVAVFNDFYLNTIAGGALPYQWTNPRTGLVADYRILGQPRAVPRSPRGDGNKDFWIVSFDVEELPGTSDVCEIVTVTGSLGNFTFAQSSSIVAQLTSRCFSGTAFSGGGTVSRTFAYSVSASNYIAWRHDAGSSIGLVIFNANLGWLFLLSSDHYPATSCGGGTRIAPLSADETHMPYMRHRGMPELVIGGTGLQDPAQLCSANPLNAWFKAIDAVLVPDCCPAPVDRATGFRYYVALCGTYTHGEAAGGAPDFPVGEEFDPISIMPSPVGADPDDEVGGEGSGAGP